MSTRRAYVRRARHSIANRGWPGFFEQMSLRLHLLASRQARMWEQGADDKPHPFDQIYGVDTAGLLWGESLDEAPDAAQSSYWTTGYYGIAPSAFAAALQHLHLDWARYTFVDVGCGKGRALLLALRYPFRAVLGIELSATLAAVATENLRRFIAPWRGNSTPAQAIAADATSFKVPAGPLLLFLYHPFAAPVMKRFLAHLQAAARAEARDIVLLYANPELDALLQSYPGITSEWHEQFSLSQADSEADRFNSPFESFAAYRVEG